MSQNSQALSAHFQKMIFEMELRGYSPQTKNHYLCHLRLLEKHAKKPAWTRFNNDGQDVDRSPQICNSTGQINAL